MKKLIFEISPLSLIKNIINNICIEQIKITGLDIVKNNYELFTNIKIICDSNLEIQNLLTDVINSLNYEITKEEINQFFVNEIKNIKY